MSLSSVNTINAILNPIFKEALRDGVIRISPISGAYAELRKSNPNTERTRHALTETEQTNLLNYIRENNRYNRWNGLITFLLGTGCRIGEALGLTWNDCDFENDVININHSLMVRNKPQVGKSRMYISTPKTKSSIREIPMLNTVKNILLDIKQRQVEDKIISLFVDNYTGFIFLNKNNNVFDYSGINQSIRCIVRSYNCQETQKANSENREPILLPNFSVHNLRHTFCTRLCKNESNLKIIQEIMGHSNIRVTMDIYNEINTEQKIISFNHLEGKIGI